MNVAEIADRSGLAPRRVRYVLEHRLVPGAARASQGRGAARDFPAAEAFAITLAARLLEAGLRRPFVKGMVRAILDAAGNQLERTLSAAPPPGEALVFEIADGQNVRLRRTPGPAAATGAPPWAQLRTGARLDRSYKPLVVVAVDVAELMRLLG